MRSKVLSKNDKRINWGS